MRIYPDIAGLDLDPIGYKLHVDNGWSIEKIDRIEREYRTFLQLAAHTSELDFRVVPSKDIDEFWHQHILDTEKYIADCEAIFGRIIHHFPYSGLLGDEDFEFQRFSYECTKELIETLTITS